MEENTFNNENIEVVESSTVVPDVVEEAPVLEEPKVEAPMPETKVEEVALDNNVESSTNVVEETTDAITTSDFSKSSNEEVQVLGSVEGGVIGAVKAPKPVKKAANKPAKNNKTVAIYSTKNVSWGKVGKVQRGYNIVTQEQADMWSTRDHIRIATPEEVAREFGK